MSIFVDISDFCIRHLSQNMRYSTPPKTFWSTVCMFHRPILIFKPLSTPFQPINKTCRVWNRVSCNKCAAGMCWHMKEGPFGWFEWPGGGALWIPSRIHSKGELHSIHIWREQNYSKIRHTSCDIYMYVVRLFKDLTARHIYIYVCRSAAKG